MSIKSWAGWAAAASVAGLSLLPAPAQTGAAKPVSDCEPLPTKITSALAVPQPTFPGAAVQCNYDLYSWMNFIAMNWPADPAKCEADLSSSILSGKGPVVWETYLADHDVFRKGGQRPLPWCPKQASDPPEGMPEEVAALTRKPGGPRAFRNESKASKKFKDKFPDFQPAIGSALIDQNGRLVRYEIRVNRDEYNYILSPNANLQANLYSARGQRTFGDNAGMPAGKSVYGPVGATEVKAAWKVMGAGDDPKRFYTTQGLVLTNQTETDPKKQKWAEVTLGMVGFHISRNIPIQPNWLWSSFEHVDNCPTEGDGPLTSYSFNNPNCPAGTCPVNQPVKNLLDELGPNGKPLNPPTQVARVIPITGSTYDMNNVFKKLLAGSVWENYRLVGTQAGGPGLGYDVKPGWLANTTIETFNQGPKPPSDGKLSAAWYEPNSGYKPFVTEGVSSSCLKCHNLAQQVNGKQADFSFLLSTAE